MAASAEYQASLDAIKRRRAIAEQLGQASMQYGGTQMSGTGRHPIAVATSPWEVASKLGQAYFAKKGVERADKEYGEIAKAMGADKQKALDALLAGGIGGGTYQQDPMADAEQGPTRGVPVAGVKGKPSPQAIQKAIDAGIDPSVIAAATPKTFSGTVGKDETAYLEGNEVAKGVPGQPELTFEQRLQLAREGKASGATVNVNTEKSLYGTMADKIGAQNADYWQQAQKAPDLIERAQRVKKAVTETQAITGAGANQMLAVAKVAAQLGFNTGDMAADTEALGRDLAASTLEGIKSSGLGAGSGFSNADRDFLEKVVGGAITLEGKTLSRLADLNERAAMKSMERWNATASRLDPQQLQILGAGPINMPGAAPAKQPTLTKNPDGSFTYQP